MINLFKTVLAILLTVALTLWAVYNRQSVAVSAGPLFDEIHIPLFILVYAGIALGFLLGLGYGWLRYGPVGRWQKNKAKKVRKDLKTARKITKTKEKSDENDTALSEDIKDESYM